MRTGGRRAPRGHRLDRRKQAAAVVPVAVRQHDGLDLAEVHAEDGGVAQQRGALGAGVEQQGVPLVADSAR